MKTTSTLLLSFIFFTEYSSASFRYWANTGTDKIPQETIAVESKNSIWDGKTIRLFGAKNEVVSFNLILESINEDNSQISVDFSELLAKNGEKILSEESSAQEIFDWRKRPIELFFVRYLKIEGLSRLGYEVYDERHVPPGLRLPHDSKGQTKDGWNKRPNHDLHYPDIAVPLELHSQFKISKNTNQQIWCDIYIPKNLTPGVYTGTVKIKKKSVIVTAIPVELKVSKFELPDEFSSKTMLHLGYSEISDRYTGIKWPLKNSAENKKLIEIRNRHFQVAHRHRITLIDADFGSENAPEGKPRDEWISRLSGELFTAKHGYAGPGEGLGNDVYSIGTYGSWSWKEKDESTMHEKTTVWKKWFNESFPKADVFLYLIDESNNFSQIEKWSKLIKSNQGIGKTLNFFATLTLPDAKKNTPSLDWVGSQMTVGPTQLWKSAFENFKSTQRKVIFYNGKRPASGSFMTDDAGTSLRMLPWVQFKFKIDRWFYWQSTYYDNVYGGTGDTSLFQSAHTFGAKNETDPSRGRSGFNYSNGDGVLFYPGTDLKFKEDSYGIAGPFASLRLKHWRRGLQDFEYLKKAAEIQPSKTNAIVMKLIPKVMWEVGVSNPLDPTWVRTAVSWPETDEAWESARKELLEIIESK